MFSERLSRSLLRPIWHFFKNITFLLTIFQLVFTPIVYGQLPTNPSMLPAQGELSYCTENSNDSLCKEIEKCNKLTDPNRNKECRLQYASEQLSSEELQETYKWMMGTGITFGIVSLITGLIDLKFLNQPPCPSAGATAFMTAGGMEMLANVIFMVEELVKARDLNQKYHQKLGSFLVGKDEENYNQNLADHESNTVQDGANRQLEAFNYLIEKTYHEWNTQRKRLIVTLTALGIMTLGQILTVVEISTGAPFVCHVLMKRNFLQVPSKPSLSSRAPITVPASSKNVAQKIPNESGVQSGRKNVQFLGSGSPAQKRDQLLEGPYQQKCCMIEVHWYQSETVVLYVQYSKSQVTREREYS